MIMCARCQKRAAVIFMTKLENGKRVNEGICVTCAKELGLPLDNLLGGMVENVNTLTTDSQSAVTEAIEKLDAIDIDTLNKAIRDLSDVVEPLAKVSHFFG